MKKKLGIIVLTLVAMAGVMMISKVFVPKPVIVINEVRSWDADTTRTGYYGSDYIELYNTSEEEVSLEGWYMSDDESDLLKSRLSGITIAAKDYVLIYANGEGESGDSVSFKINPEGEKIFLSNFAGERVDSIFVPKQELGTVYARVIDGGKEWAVKEPSILASNNDAEILPTRSLADPVFSHETGFYDEAFELTLSADKGQTIYYTLDGSIPTQNSEVYDGSIRIENRSAEPNVVNGVQNIRPDWLGYGPDQTPVDKAMIVRAVAMDENNHASQVVTNTYFVDLEQYKDENVISVVSEYDELFGDNGIFVTGKEYDKAYLSGMLDGSIIPNIHKGGRRWEAFGNLQMIENGEETINQEIGIRIQGASSRNGKRKRSSIYAREEYSGDQYLKGLIFEDGKEAHSVMLVSEKANVILQELVKDRSVATQSAVRTTMFLNGEFYHRTFILEKYNKYYLQDHFGVNPENVMLVKGEEVSEGPELSDKFYGQMVNLAAETDLSIQENYDNLCSQMDMQSFIDYMCANAYLCNMDMSETKNYVIWRTIENEGTKYGDARWRWMIYDVDCLVWAKPESYGVERKSQIDSFSKVMDYTGKAMNEHSLFVIAKANEEFCKQFVLTFMDMANTNFSIENVEKAFAKWDVSLDEYDGFFKERFNYIVPYMAEEFNLTGTLENVTLKINDADGGIIQLNTTTPDLSDGSWTGKYYTDYSVTATAIPTDGYEFAGWSGSVTSDSDTIEAEVEVGGIVLEACFRKMEN